MAEPDTVSIGKSNAIRFDFTWQDDGSNSYLSRTYGRLTVWVDDKPIWFGRDTSEGVLWNWDVFLENLAFRWIQLTEEETYPGDIAPALPSQLRPHSELAWQGQDLTEEELAADEGAVFAFESAHDLSRWIDGIALPPLFILREGASVWIDSTEPQQWPPRAIRFSVAEITATLEAVGTALIDRLQQASDDRADWLRRIWSERSNISADERLAIKLGLAKSRVLELARHSTEISSLLARVSDTPRSERLLIAARMLADRVPDGVLENVLGELAALSAGATKKADVASTQAKKSLEAMPDTAFYLQGKTLGRWFRNFLSINATDRIEDILSVYEKLDVPVFLRDFGNGSNSIDAFACWGADTGAVVCLNQSGMHIQQPFAKRATLAHELCHLLVDREEALPAVEVLGGRVPEGPEKRARAFAAEFLLPCKAIGERLSGTDPDDVIKITAAEFNVSYQLAANQAINWLHDEARRKQCKPDDVLGVIAHRRLQALRGRPIDGPP